MTFSFRAVNLSNFTVDDFFNSSESQRHMNLGRIKHLLPHIIPICNESIDLNGNRSRLWSLPNKGFFGTVSHSDGKVSIIFTDKIINSCNKNSFATLQRLKESQGLQFDLVFNQEKKQLILFPHLRAAALDDPITKIKHPITKVVTERLKQGKEISWCAPHIKEIQSVLNHMFRKSNGHFDKDTSENRSYILAAVSDPNNKIATNKFGIEIYCKLMPDGYRAWAYVQNGMIVNGGRDTPWKKWQPPLSDSLKDAGRMAPIPVTIFREQVQIDRLTNVFNTTIGENYWEPHPLETVTVGRDVGGVRHEIGIIVDLLQELQSSEYNDYLFFIPQTEGTDLLEKKEILQIVQEIAKGIYLHDTIPFFSLNMNPQQQNYSIIHPCYQNTYVGHVISMLDYYLKGFWTGQLFDQSFIQEWSKNPTMDEGLLKQHLLSMKELCQLREEKSFLNFNQILQSFIEESSLTPEQLAILAKETKNLVLSCKILGKQNSIPKHQNLFVLDGEVQLIHTIEWEPEGSDQELCHQILDRACMSLCQQIQHIGFKLPLMQKWLSALQIMNFFSTYFRTLKQAEKIPIFSESIQVDSQKICPSIFPPIPYPSGAQVEIEPKAILGSLSSSQKQILQEYCQKDSEDNTLKETLRSILITTVKSFPIELSSEHMQPCIDTILSAFRSGYRSIDQQIEKLFIDLKITSVSYHSMFQWVLRININEVKSRANQAISELKRKIASKKIYDQDSDQLESLIQIQTTLDQATQWISDPLSTLVEKESWLYDIEQKKLIAKQKTPSGETLKVYGGYEPKLANMNSQESQFAKDILQQNKKKLDSLKYEDIISIPSKNKDSISSGVLFKLPIEDSFPISSYGIPYNTIQLFSSSIKNADDHTFNTLLQSIREEDLETFSALYETEINYNRLDFFGRGAIHYAALSPSTYFLQALIHKKVNLLTPDSQGWTALHHAASTGNLPVINLLLSADPQSLNTVAINGETPIYLAVHNNQWPVVEKLIEANVDLNLKPSHSYNLLLSAIHNGHEEMALLLAQSGKIDLNYSWRNGKTALHFAIEMKMEKLLEALLQKGVDRNYPYLGKKPILLAQEHGWERGVEILNTNFAYQEATCTIL